MIKNFLLRLVNPAVITNLAYSIAGYSMLAKGYDTVMGISMILLGILSGIYHYVFDKTTRFFDWLGMYMVFSWFPAVLLLEEFNMAIWGAIVIACTSLDLFTKIKRTVILGIVAAISLISASVVIGIEPMLYVVSNFAIAFIPWVIAEHIHNEDHYSIMHGLWHILTTVAIYDFVETIYNHLFNVL